MEPLDHAADQSIRRALGFAGLAMATIMLALSYDIALALRSGANLMALAALVLLLNAWRAHNSDPRDSETWAIFCLWSPERAAGLSRAEAKRLLGTSLRRRLLWHAEKVGLGAVALWALLGLIFLSRLMGAAPAP